MNIFTAFLKTDKFGALRPTRKIVFTSADSKTNKQMIDGNEVTLDDTVYTVESVRNGI